MPGTARGRRPDRLQRRAAEAPQARVEVRAALRHSYVGCADRDVVGLNRAERDLCDERFGKGARDAKFAGLGLSPEKQRLLDAASTRRTVRP